MHETPTVDDLKEKAKERGKDGPTRKVVIVLMVVWLITLAALVGVTFNAYFSQKEKTQTLAQQIRLACDSGTFGPGMSSEDINAICRNAEKVIENNGAELQDDEIQEREIQEDEIQEDEIQEDEIQQPENQQGETQEAEDQEEETQDGETQDAEIQDDEIQNEEIQDDEIQNEEIDDPDPASPFNFRFTVPGSNPADPSRTFVCNSGTGECTLVE